MGHVADNKFYMYMYLYTLNYYRKWNEVCELVVIRWVWQIYDPVIGLVEGGILVMRCLGVLILSWILYMFGMIHFGSLGSNASVVLLNCKFIGL